MAVSPSRKIAYDILFRVASEGAYASDLLHSQLGPSVRNDDAALATEISLGVLRWQRLLDFLLERHIKKPIAKLDLPVAIALRMGLYQLRFFERVPARAAVNESVELVKAARKSSASTLVNAVLRRASNESRVPAEQLIAASYPNLSQPEKLSALHSHPEWLVARWLARWGEARTIAVMNANNQTPNTSCAVNDASRRAEIIASLESTGLRGEPGTLLAAAFSARGGSVVRTEAFRRGEISVQDEASQAVPLLLEVQLSDRVLDLCAAPGGKTAIFSRAAGPEGRVIAADLHGHRLRACKEQLARVGATNVDLIELNATAPLPFATPFDRILVDAPCSGTGTLARHPEIRWRLTAAELSTCHALQTSLLQSALAQLAPQGRLVYSTCSMEPEENEAVVDAVLAATGNRFRRVAAAQTAAAFENKLADGVQISTLVNDSGEFRTDPAEHHTDGFFATAIERQT